MDQTRVNFIQHAEGRRQAWPVAGLQPGDHAGPHHHRPRQADHHRRHPAADRLGQYQQPLDGLRHRVRHVASRPAAPDAAANRAEITRLRNTAAGPLAGLRRRRPWTPAIAKAGGVGAGLEALRTGGYARLRPIEAHAAAGRGSLHRRQPSGRSGRSAGLLAAVAAPQGGGRPGGESAPADSRKVRIILSLTILSANCGCRMLREC